MQPNLLRVEDVFGDLPPLETSRLLLRKLTADDAGDIFEYASDPEVPRYTTWQTHQRLDDTLVFLNSVLDSYARGHVAPWGVVHKADRKVVGTCGFISWFPAHARAEVAYAIGRKYWNQGLTTEAVRAVIAFGFHAMRLNRVEARCEVLNVASARVMEKNRMVFEGVLRQQMFAKGHFRDLRIYSLLRSEWEMKEDPEV